MEFRRKHYHPFHKPFSASEAVTYECGASTLTDGRLECAEEAAENAGKMLGRLVDLLMARGVLNVEEFEQLTGWERV